jgi:hypothetical protein
MERVLKIDSHRDQDEVRTEVIHLATHPSLAFEAVAAVELSVGRLRNGRGGAKNRR